MNQVTKRITTNEKRLDDLALSIEKLDKALDGFKSNRKNLILLKKYYGSKNWFNDKEAYEKKKISGIKAGVLSEDAIWNMLDDVDELLNKMDLIFKTYKK